jgi:hypothetical protein
MRHRRLHLQSCPSFAGWKCGLSKGNSRREWNERAWGFCVAISSPYKAMISSMVRWNVNCLLTVSMAEVSHWIGSAEVWPEKLAFPYTPGRRGTIGTGIEPRRRTQGLSEWAIFSKCSLTQWPVHRLCSVMGERNTNGKTKKLTKLSDAMMMIGLLWYFRWFFERIVFLSTTICCDDYYFRTDL